MEDPTNKGEELSKKAPAVSSSSSGRRAKEGSVNAVNTAHQAPQQYSVNLMTAPTIAPTYFPPPPQHQLQSIYYSALPANPLPDHRPSSGPSINMISICVSERDEEAQENPPPFVINYTPEELTVGFTGHVASPAPFVVDVLAREPYSDSKCNNYIICRVMIDNGSALNVCPVTTLKQMNVDLNRVRPSKTAVRAFDGSRREVNGEIDLLIDVGPCSFSITFQENEELDNWTSVSRYSAVIVDVLHSNPNPRRFGSNLSREQLSEPQPVYFGEGLPEDSQVPEIEESLRRLEDHQITSVEPTKEINAGTEEEPHTLKIGTALNPAQRARMIDFLKEYQEVFTWSYADMLGLDPSIVEHFLPLDIEKFPPKRQQLRRQRAGLLLRIKEEVVKQINAGFLEVCNYSEWVANIVPVEKKDGRVRVCIDYRDLNKANPKDNFPLPHIDCQPLFRLLRKNAAMDWDHECQKAFDTIKAYLIQPPILVPPVPSRPLILYLTVRRQSLGCMLGQEDKSTRTERAIYYLSKKLTEGESNYPEIEKMCCALVWVMQGLRHPSSTRNLAKWRCLLTEYDIEYVSRTSVKGQAIADHLAEFPIEDHTPINPDFPDEGILQIDDEGEKPGWKMYFDGAVNSTGSEIDFPARSKTSSRRPRQKLGNEWHT
ncbi:hypothetical protein CRG98_002661 [Punica granatum]|uniref:Reverse transcriptase/retrotransposon-derived protein RNase H-like domain-containing protein n=1 Tax=Punica granatum TaxID=22663 RepID=A0A2I0L8C8_PUNGR|nr:hypothetical protein CRG98_002661 [Punica granatum]